MWTEERFLNFASKPSALIIWHLLGLPSLSLGTQGSTSSQEAPTRPCSESSTESEQRWAGVVKMNSWSILAILRIDLSWKDYLCIVVEPTKECCVADKNAAEKELIETKVASFGQEVVVAHLECPISVQTENGLGYKCMKSSE